MMKKWWIEIGSVAMVALCVATACAQAAGSIFEHARTSGPEFADPSSTPATRHRRTPAATPAANPHKPSAAEKAVAQFTPTNDPKEIVRRSMEIDRRTLELARNYTCQQREVIKHLDKNGNVKSTEVKTYDVGFYYGEEYSRLIDGG